MSVTADLIRGHTETIILGHLLRGDRYGYEINKAISTTTEGRYELKEATLYSAFRRLEEQGLICSYWGDAGSAARRRYYHITPTGQEVYARRLADWRAAREIIDRLLEEQEQ